MLETGADLFSVAEDDNHPHFDLKQVHVEISGAASWQKTQESSLFTEHRGLFRIWDQDRDSLTRTVGQQRLL